MAAKAPWVVLGVVGGLAACSGSSTSSDGGCSSNIQCPDAAPCCAPGSATPSEGTCVARGASAICLCASGSECETGCCAPLLNGNGDPVGPNVCKPGDGLAYNCCRALNQCSGSACCAAAATGSDLCVTECTDSSTCGAAHCISYTALGVSTCSTSPVKACGP